VTSKPDGKLHSAKQFAELLGVCTRTLSRLVQRGDIPKPKMVGGQRRWYAQDVQKCLTKEAQDHE